MVAAASSPITYTLPGFPLVSQLSDPPGDTYPDNNQRMNCVPASLSAGASWLTKRIYYGNQLKDAVYGVAYQGPQAAVDYVAYLASIGVALTPYNNTNGAQLVAHIHAAVAAGVPVVLTMPSQWGIPYPNPLRPSGFTHVGIACGSGPGWLRIMNPWGGFWHDGSDSYWLARLCMGQVWDMSLSAKGVPLMAWHRQPDKTGMDDQGHTCGEGVMDAIAVDPTLAASDGLMKETYYTPTMSFLPLASGAIVSWDSTYGAHQNGAAVLVNVWDMLQTAQAQIAQLEARPTSDPTEHAKAAALDAVMAVYGVK